MIEMVYVVVVQGCVIDQCSYVDGWLCGIDGFDIVGKVWIVEGFGFVQQVYWVWWIIFECDWCGIDVVVVDYYCGYVL